MMKVVVETPATTTDLLLFSCSQLKGNRVAETREGSPPQKAAPHRPPAAAHLPLQPPSLLPPPPPAAAATARLPPCPPASRTQPGQAAAEIPPDTGAATSRGGRGKGEMGRAAQLGFPTPSKATPSTAEGGRAGPKEKAGDGGREAF